MCIDDNDKYKLFSRVPSSSCGSIQFEVTACDPSARADPSTCVTDEAKLQEFLDKFNFRVNLISNFKEYDTHSY